MNQLAEVGRVTPCAPSCAWQESVVAAVGAQRTARPIFWLMGSTANIAQTLSTESVRKEGSILRLDPKVVGQVLWIQFDYNGARS